MPACVMNSCIKVFCNETFHFQLSYQLNYSLIKLYFLTLEHIFLAQFFPALILAVPSWEFLLNIFVAKLPAH